MTFQTLDDDSVETRLRDAGTRPTTARPIEELQARARQLRRRRRAVRAGGLGAGVLAAGLACAVALSPTVRGDLRSGLDGAAQAAGVDLGLEEGSCNTGYGYVGAFSDVPDLLYLPARSAAGAPSLTYVRMGHSDCAPDPLALVAYRPVPGGPAVEAGVTIHGPGARNPYETSGDGHFMGRIVEEPNVQGDLTSYVMADGDQEVPIGGYWTDTAGQSWWLETRGFEAGELADLVDGLSTHGGTIDPKSLPEAFTAWRVAGGINPEDYPTVNWVDNRDLVQPVQDTWSLTASYGDAEPPDWTFMVNRDANLIERAGASPGATPLRIEVLGKERNAVWSEGKLGQLSWELANGIVASVSGLRSLEEAKRVAESLVRVEADDPLLTEVREKAPRDVPEN